jgi:hypothetical protein
MSQAAGVRRARGASATCSAAVPGLAESGEGSWIAFEGVEGGAVAIRRRFGLGLRWLRGASSPRRWLEGQAESLALIGDHGGLERAPASGLEAELERLVTL